MARDNTVTYVKALGIILMVLGHVLSSDMLVRRAILTFHMPLFFLMSGYCFKEKYLDDAKQFVMRKIKGIYMPYVLFALPFLALHNVFCHWHLYESTWLYGWKDFAWNAGRIVTRMSMNEGLLGTFWFLKELFWGESNFLRNIKVGKMAIGYRKMEIGSRMVDGDRIICVDGDSMYIPSASALFWSGTNIIVCSIFHWSWLSLEEIRVEYKSMVDMGDRYHIRIRRGESY